MRCLRPKWPDTEGGFLISRASRRSLLLIVSHLLYPIDRTRDRDRSHHAFETACARRYFGCLAERKLIPTFPPRHRHHHARLHTPRSSPMLHIFIHSFTHRMIQGTQGPVASRVLFAWSTRNVVIADPYHAIVHLSHITYMFPSSPIDSNAPRPRLYFICSWLIETGPHPALWSDGVLITQSCT